MSKFIQSKTTMVRTRTLRIFMLLSITLTAVHCQKVVPLGLAFDFVDYFIGKSIVVHANTQDMKMDLLMTAKEVNKRPKYVMIVDYSQENCTNITLENVDVHFISLAQESMPYLFACLNYRKRSDKEPWVFYAVDTEVMKLADDLVQAKLDLDDNIITAIHNTDMDAVELYEFYKVSMSTPIQYNYLGTWSTKDGLKMTTVPKWYRRKDLKGHHFQVTTLAETPFTSRLEYNKNTGIWEIEGSFPDLLNTLATTMNFTYTLEPPPDNAWGGRQPDGSWNGMMNLVEKELADFAPTSLIQTVERELSTDWTIPLVFSYQSIFIKNPTNVYNYTAYLEPMTYLSWAMVVVFLAIIPIFLFYVGKHSHDENVMSLGGAFAAVFVALLLLGSANDPNKYSTRILFLSIIVASALIYWHWEAMLVSYLATRKTVLPFAGITEMYQNTEFRLALIPSTTYEDNFKYSPDPIFKGVYEDRIKPHLEEYSSYENYLTDMVYFIKNDFSTALYDGYLPITSTKEYQDCLIVVTEGKYFTRPYAWPFPKFSPYLPIFNFYISELIEKGQWNAIINKYTAQPQVCPDMSGMPIEFANCFTAFLILIGGGILAVVLMLSEFAIKPFDKFTMNNALTEKVENMDRGQLEFTVNKQQEMIARMKAEIGLYQKEFQRI